MAGYSENQQQEIDAFLAKLPTLDDETLQQATEKYIWLSAFANNNPRSAYHPMCDGTYDEWLRRGKPEGYTSAHCAVMRQEGYA